MTEPVQSPNAYPPAAEVQQAIDTVNATQADQQRAEKKEFKQRPWLMGFLTARWVQENRILRDVGLLLVRFFSLALILHGVTKIAGFSGLVEKSLAHNPLTSWAPGLFGVLTVAVEIGAPILLFLGLCTRWVGLGLAVFFGGIIATVFLPTQGLIGESGSLTFEPALLYLIIGLVCFFLGAGRLSMDHVLTRRHSRKRS